MYHQGYAVKVTTAMKDAMEAENWALELRVCCQPPDAAPSDTRLHPLGGPSGCAGAGECTSARPAVGSCAPALSPGHGGTGAHNRLEVRAADNGALAVGGDVTCPPGCNNHNSAAVAVDCHRSSRGGKIQIPRGVRGAQLPITGTQGPCTTRSAHWVRYRLSPTRP